MSSSESCIVSAFETLKVRDIKKLFFSKLLTAKFPRLTHSTTSERVEIILYVMYYYLSYLFLCLLIILAQYKTIKTMLKMLLTSVDLMYSRTSVSCCSDPHLFCGLNWLVIANKVIIHFTHFVPSSSTKPIFARLTDVARMDVQLEINVYVGLNRNIRIVSKYLCPLTDIELSLLNITF